MSLSCYCDDDDDADWHWFGPDDYTTLATKRWRKCCSCKGLIRPGELCAEFKREAPTREYEDEIKYRIWQGNPMPLATWYMCEACADQYFNLTALGYCVNLPSNMDALRREYVAMTTGRQA